MRKQIHQYLAFLNENSLINMQIFIFLYDFLLFFGIYFHFETKNVYSLFQVSKYAQKLLIRFAIFTESATQLNSLYLFLMMLLNCVPYVMIFFCKRFARRPATFLVKMFILFIAMLCFILYEVIDAFWCYYSFSCVKQQFLTQHYFDVVLVVLFQLVQLWFNIKYRQSLNYFTLDTDYTIYPDVLVLMYLVRFTVISTSTLFYEVQLLSEALMMAAAVGIAVYIAATGRLRVFKTQRWVECFAFAFLGMLMFESVVQMVCLASRRQLQTDYVRIACYVVILACAFLKSRANTSKYVDLAPEAVIGARATDKPVTSLSLDFVLQLCAYNGPEFYGLQSDDAHADFSNQTERAENVSESDCFSRARLIGECEQTLETFKLLYERIYGNIFLNYALCGQSLEHISLLDVEEALPVPLLLRYLRCWRAPEEAFASILHLLKQHQHMNRIRGIESGEYTAVSMLRGKCFAERKRQMADLLRGCVDSDDMEGIDLHEYLQAFMDNRERDSVNPDLELFQTSYEMPSDQKFAGDVVYLSAEDIVQHKHLFAHFPREITAEDRIFVILPTFCTVSSVTGNLHRLCFNNGAIASKTQQLRRIRIYALMSLARIMFPLRKKIEGKFRMPLVAPFTFMQFKYTHASRYTRFSSPFLLDITPQRTKTYRSSVLYYFSPFLLGEQLDQFADSQSLQFVLVEYFLTRQVLTGEASPRLYKFYQAFYAQQTRLIHKLMAFQDCQYDEKEVCAMPDDVVINALAVQFSSAIIDERSSPLTAVIDKLVHNRHMFASRHSNCIFRTWTKLNIGKFRMYLLDQMNESPDYFLIEAFVKYIEEFGMYQEFVDKIEYDIYDQHLSLVQEVAKMLYKYRYQYFGIMMLYHDSQNPGRPLFLIPDQTCYSEFDNDEFPNEVSLPSVYLIHQTIFESSRYLKKLATYYNFIKLSNHLFYLYRVMRLGLSKQPKDVTYLRRDGLIINNCLLGIYAFVDFLTSDLRAAGSKINEYSYISSSSFSSSITNDTDYSTNNGSASYLNTDINLNNPQKFEDDFSLINNNYYNIDLDNILVFNHYPDQNTPEFLINVMKHDFKSLKSFNLIQFQYLLHHLTKLHYIKMHDQSIRAKNLIFYILPRICNIQYEVETNIQKFLLYIQNARSADALDFNAVRLEYAISSISVIENQISKLFAANSLLLSRQHISDDQLQIIREDVYRSVSLTYGQPEMLFGAGECSKDKLILMCDTYSGSDEKLHGAVRRLSGRLRRIGGRFAYDTLFSYKNHPSWGKYRFEPANSPLKSKNAFESEKRKGIFWFTVMLALSLLFLLIAFSMYYFGRTSLVMLQLQTQRISQAMFGIGNVIDDVGMCSYRRNFQAYENSTFVMLNFNKYRYIQEQLLIAHINANAIARRESFYSEYIRQLNGTPTTSLYVSYEDFYSSKNYNPYKQTGNVYVNEKLFQDLYKLVVVAHPFAKILEHLFRKQNRTLFYNISSINIMEDVYTPFIIFGTQFENKFAKQLFDIPMLTGIKQLTLLYAMEYYIQQSNILNHEALLMIQQFNDSHFKELYYQHEFLKTSYTQTFTMLFYKVFECIVYQQQCSFSLLRQILVFIMLIAMYALARTHFKAMLNPLMEVDIDRGSVISSILDLPVKLLQAIHDKYRKATQLTNTKRYLFLVQRMIHDKEISTTPVTNKTQIKQFRYIFSIYNKLFYRRKMCWICLLILMTYALRIVYVVIVLVGIQLNFSYSNLNVYNKIPDAGVMNTVKPFLTQQLQLFGEEFKKFYNLNNAQQLAAARNMGLAPQDYLRAVLDSEYSMPQISYDVMFLLKYSEQEHKGNQDCVFLYPYFEMLRIYNMLKLISDVDTNFSQDDYKYLNVILAQRCMKYDDQFACVLTTNTSNIDLNISGIYDVVQRYGGFKGAGHIKTVLFATITVNFVFQLCIVAFIATFVITYMRHHRVITRSESKQVNYIYNIGQMLYPDIECYTMQLLALISAIECIVSLIFHVYYFVSIAKNTPSWLHNWRRLDFLMLIQLLGFVLISIYEQKTALKAYIILSNLGFPDSELQMTVTESLQFGSVLYYIEDKDEVQHPTCQYVTNGYLLPYPLQSHRHYRMEFVGLIVVVIFSVILLVSSLFVVRDSGMTSEFSMLSSYQSCLNQETALTSKYYTHSYDRCINCGALYYLQNVQRDAYNYIRNSDALQSKIHERYARNLQYSHPTFYQFVELIQDQRFHAQQDADFNKANYNFQQMAEPSILYGVNNISRFLQLRQPRDKRFGIHLQTAIGDYDMQSTVVGGMQLESLKQQIAQNTISQNLVEIAAQMNSMGTFGPFDMKLTLQQQYVYQYARERQSDIWIINHANNREIVRIVRESVDKDFARSKLLFFAAASIEIVFYLVAMLSYRSLYGMITRYVYKTVIFTTLFLKRIRGISVDAEE